MAAPSAVYEPRTPAAGVLYQVVRDHFETFREQAAGLRDTEGLPRFVEQEFREFLGCGYLAGGFARFHCGGCGYDRLVPFSCQGRAVFSQGILGRRPDATGARAYMPMLRDGQYADVLVALVNSTEFRQTLDRTRRGYRRDR